MGAANPPWPPRFVKLVLCTASDGVIGCLPQFEAANVQWREVETVVEHCLERYGFKPVVLRLLSSPRHVPPFGGVVAYLAEVDRVPAIALEPWDGPDPLTAQPNRLPYAQIGGPQAELDWAARILAELGITSTGDPVQVRTWNLSSIWRLSTDSGQLWLKSTPPFCAHEGAVMSLLPPGLVPPVLGFESGRVLLGEVAGDDQYNAAEAALVEMIDALVMLQIDWTARVDELVGLGARDWRPAAFLPAAQRVFERLADELDGEERGLVTKLLESFDDGFARLAACGIPDTLVHGDFHSGNVRGNPGAYRFLDWGDCGVGNPLIDELAFCERRPAAQVATLRAAWADAWSRQLPGSDPERAATLLRPLTSLSGAVVYQAFLDGIEPDEWVYHEDDPIDSLRWAAKVAAEGGLS